jgi:hypothetical protein
MPHAMQTRSKALATILALLASAVALANPGTREDRAALFDYIVRATMERTAFAPKKPADIGAAWGAGEHVTMAEFVRREMLRYRDEMISADTDDALYYVLTKLSDARFDSHVRGVGLVEGGLRPAMVLQTREYGTTHAPIRFRPDYTNGAAMFFFVSDFAKNFVEYAPRTPQIGDKLVAVNNRPIDQYVDELRRFVGYSSHRAVWWRMAMDVAERDPIRAPPFLYEGDRITFDLESRAGERYRLNLPYVKYESIDWAGHDDVYGIAADRRAKIRTDPSFMSRSLQGRISLDRYNDFERLFSRPAFDVYESKAKRVFVLQSHGFATDTIATDLDALLEHARKNDVLDYAVIFDLTRGAGGDLEEYTLQRLQSQPFKIIFGNLRISEITPELAAGLRREALESVVKAGKRSSPILAQQVVSPDNGEYLLEWLDNHLARVLWRRPVRCHVHRQQSWPQRRHARRRLQQQLGVVRGSEVSNLRTAGREVHMDCRTCNSTERRGAGRKLRTASGARAAHT